MHARVLSYLDFDGNLSTILQHAVMHLADGSCSKRFILEGRELLSPAWPKLLIQNFLLNQKHTLQPCPLRLLTLLTIQLCQGHIMLTFICHVGMKSALCRTLSKIFCSWGLMKVLSERGK